MIPFLVGCVVGVVVTLILYRPKSSVAPVPQSDAEQTLMAISAEIQTQLDRLAQVPGQIQAAKAAAVQAATTQQAQDHADEVAALASATDAVVAAAGQDGGQG